MGPRLGRGLRKWCVEKIALFKGAILLTFITCKLERGSKGDECTLFGGKTRCGFVYIITHA